MPSYKETSVYAPTQALGASWDREEEELIRELVSLLSLSAKERGGIVEQSTALGKKVRVLEERGGVIQAVMREYNLNSEEGVLLMCLAEGLLRIPDKRTSHSFIAGKLARGDWTSHLWRGNVWLDISTVGLLCSKGVLGFRGKKGLFRSLLYRLSRPIIRRVMNHIVSLMGKKFIYGQEIEQGLKKSSGCVCSFDMLGEGAWTRKDGEKYFSRYMEALEAIGREGSERNHGLSIKLSAIHPRFDVLQRERVYEELVPRVLELARLASVYNVPLCIDAEESDRLHLTLGVFSEVCKDKKLKDWEGFGVALQSYQRRGLAVVRYLEEIAQQTKRRLMPRLVKGAYWDTEIKHYQELGLRDYAVFTRKCYTDISYLVCSQELLRLRDRLYPCFATHNLHTACSVLQMSGGDYKGWEFQRLHGMGACMYKVLQEKFAINPPRIYAPVGGQDDLLAYLVRRLLENGANSSFVQQLSDKTKKVEEVMQDPLHQKGKSCVRKPGEILRGRRNSRGMNMRNEKDLLVLEQSVSKLLKSLRKKETSDSGKLEVRSPNDRSLLVGAVESCGREEAVVALGEASLAQEGWRRRSKGERRKILEDAALRMEEKSPELVSLISVEGGRCLEECISEVREGIDFLRYYAVESEKVLQEQLLVGATGEENRYYVEGKGVFLCISPWNFPFAIFLGQVCAALSVGNSVLAKPSELTPLIAFEAVKILYEAGVPRGVLHVLPGEGEEVCSEILLDNRLSGVAFTGSTETARKINRRLSQREGSIATLIAETGGINAMVVDSSALTEQVTRDVLSGAFRSAGQRCSALRVLYLQEEIAEKQIEMIGGALEELKVGISWDRSTDIGPVISGEAQREIEEWVEGLPSRGCKRVACGQVPSSRGYFVPPQAWLLPDIRLPEKEVFGPILHISRYKKQELDEVLEEINGTGYGLTFGFHSRCDDRIEKVSKKMRAGNIYVNRNQIGAQVGIHPFGGCGLSGTGPKAGGPRYLHSFTTEKTVSIDTTASGGDMKLLSAGS